MMEEMASQAITCKELSTKARNSLMYWDH